MTSETMATKTTVGDRAMRVLTEQHLKAGRAMPHKCPAFKRARKAIAQFYRAVRQRRNAGYARRCHRHQRVVSAWTARECLKNMQPVDPDNRGPDWK